MSLNSEAHRQELGKRIRTLTSLLGRFDVQESPSKQPTNIHTFLHDFTALLTCDDDQVKGAVRVAVTGSISAHHQARLLVVSQNPHLRSTANTAPLKFVKKDKKPLAEVLESPANVPLLNHISDLWAALFAFDPTAPGHRQEFKALTAFFLSRCFRRFVTRFRQDVQLCGGKRLHEVISEWCPDRSELDPRWVRPPRWLLDIKYTPQMKSRTIQGQVEWEFSDDTKQDWSKILAMLLYNVDKAVEGVATARNEAGETAKEEVRQAMVTLNYYSYSLYKFVKWRARVVKTLLTKTNMVDGIPAELMPTTGGDEIGEDGDNFLQEPGESKGQRIYRYLKTALAWHAAIRHLFKDEMLPKLLKNIEICLIEVPPSPTTVLTRHQIASAFFARFPEMKKHRKAVENALRLRHSDTFRGFVHAEARLMGLLNYYLHEASCGKDEAVSKKKFRGPREILQTATDAGHAVIAASGKCCLCCAWLGGRLETWFNPPGTHGVMYPWDPPMVGVSVSIVEELEEELWTRLHRLVLETIESPHSAVTR